MAGTGQILILEPQGLVQVRFSFKKKRKKERKKLINTHANSRLARLVQESVQLKKLPIEEINILPCHLRIWFYQN